MKNILLNFVDKKPRVFQAPYAPKIVRRTFTFCFGHGIKIIDVSKIKDILGDSEFNQLRLDLNKEKEVSPELIHRLREMNLPRIKCKLKITLELFMYKEHNFLKQLKYTKSRIDLVRPGDHRCKSSLAITDPNLETFWELPGLKKYLKKIGLMEKGISKKIMEKILDLDYLKNNTKSIFFAFQYAWLDIHLLKLTLLIDENKIKLP